MPSRNCERSSSPPSSRCLTICSRSLLRSIDEAPQDIRSIVEELNFLNQVLEGIKQNEQDFGCHTTTQMGLERCLETIDALNSMAGSFAEGFLSRNIIRRKWTALESVRKNDQIAKFKAKLHEAKLNLIMAQQSSAASVTFPSLYVKQELTFLGGRITGIISRIKSHLPR
jgi:hypothetical protein